MDRNIAEMFLNSYLREIQVTIVRCHCIPIKPEMIEKTRCPQKHLVNFEEDQRNTDSEEKNMKAVTDNQPKNAYCHGLFIQSKHGSI